MEYLLCTCYFSFFLFLFYWVRVSLSSPGWSRTFSVNQASLKFRNPLVSTFQVLNACSAFLSRLFCLWCFCCCILLLWLESYFFLRFFSLVCVLVFNVHVCMCSVSVPGTYKGQNRGLGSSRPGLLDYCESLCRCWNRFLVLYKSIKCS